jgi:hypothetical protein
MRQVREILRLTLCGDVTALEIAHRRSWCRQESPRQLLGALSARPKAVHRSRISGRRGRYQRILRALVGVQLLIIDDFGLSPVDADARHDLLEILEQR